MLLNKSSLYNPENDGVYVWKLTSSDLSLGKDSGDLASHGKGFSDNNNYRV